MCRLQGVLENIVSPVRLPNCLSVSCSEKLFPVGGSLVVVVSVGLVKEISVYLYLVQGLFRSDLPAYILVEIHF